MTKQVEELTQGEALTRVAVLEAEVAALRKRVCVPDGWKVERDGAPIYVKPIGGAGVWLYPDGDAHERVMWAYFDALLAAPPAPAPVERNQCDGCQAGIPVEGGMHRMGKPGGYADLMACTAERYGSAPAERATDKESLSVERLWAVHAQGPDDLYPAFNRDDAEKHAAALSALSEGCSINVSAVVIESPWPAAEHWKYLAEQEREHAEQVAAPASGLLRIIIEALEFYASGSHFMPSDKDEWDTVSGEPQNWLYGENADAGVEDGQIAMAALAAYKRRPAPVERLATDGGRNQRFEGLFEGETPDQRNARLASAAPVELVEQEAAVLAVQPAMNWRNCYHRASMDLCAIGELLGVPEEDQCTPEIIEAIKALQQSNPPEQVEPVAWMHDSPGRVDVISAEVKKLLVDSHDTAGHLHRPLDKSEHYTIPLYTAPAMKEHEEMKNAMQLAQGPKPTTLGQLHDYLDSIRKAWSAQDTKYLGSYESQPLYILPNDPTPGFQLAEAKYFAEFGLTFIPVEGASK